jgi:hypothetical protein
VFLLAVESQNTVKISIKIAPMAAIMPKSSMENWEKDSPIHLMAKYF